MLNRVSLALERDGVEIGVLLFSENKKNSKQKQFPKKGS